MSASPAVSFVLRRALLWMGRGVVFAVAAVGLIVGGVLGQIAISFLAG